MGGAFFAQASSGEEVETRSLLQGEERGPDGEILWGDEDEVQYREWIKEQIEGREPAEFSEYQSEEEYRNRLREETKENELRLKYLKLRKQRREQGPVEWDISGE